MDWTIVVVVAIFGLIVIVVARSFGKQIKASIKGPAGLSLDVEASGEPSPAEGGVRIEGAKAGRDVSAEDATGKGAVLKDVDAGRDAKATSTKAGDARKKA